MKWGTGFESHTGYHGEQAKNSEESHMDKERDPHLVRASKVVEEMRPRLRAFLIRQGIKDRGHQHDIIQDTVMKLGGHFRHREVASPSDPRIETESGKHLAVDSEIEPLVWLLLRNAKVDRFRCEIRFPALRDMELLLVESRSQPSQIDLDEIKHALPPRNARIVEMLCDGHGKESIRNELHIGRREWSRIEASIRQVIKDRLN